MQKTEFNAYHKVRGYECDFYGHANNATYLNYLEYARGELLIEAGLSLPKLKEEGISIVLRRVEITYRSPAKINDMLRICTTVASFSRVTCTFHQEIFRESDDVLVAEADVTWTVINAAGRPMRLPEVIREALALTDSPENNVRN